MSSQHPLSPTDQSPSTLLPSLLPPPPEPDTPTQFNRLSLPFPTRIALSCTTASLAGFFLGAAKGMRDSEMRFRAENAHRLPSTTAGWYLYHKSKNYNALLGGIKEGARFGLRLAGTGVFFAMEEGVDRGRARIVRVYRNTVGRPRREVDEEEDALRLAQVAGNRDFLSSGLAGLGTGGMYAAWQRLPLPTATRLMKMGMKYGLLWGLLQDAVNVMRGRRLGYVEFLKRAVGGGDKTAEDPQVAEAVS